mmetsp:Transcript_20608/g.83648  ORF Transcript_20608/g.83648 Transcript_20608/m.83648 type:complete len:367 (-) Transcript_20608:1040-2140(-)
MNSSKSQTVRFAGTKNLRSRLILSVLAGRTVVIENIRVNESLDGGGIGLKDYEVSFLRLVDKLTNGSKVKINEIGTAIRLVPGVPVGGEFEHECPVSRPIGYFVEWILPLALFCKNSVSIKFRGVTNAESALTIDSIQSTTIPLLRRVAGINVSVKLVKRGAEPGGGGLVIFTCQNSKSIPPLELTDAGVVKRIRGVAYSTRVAPSYTNRLVGAARGVLNRFTPDVYIYTDHHSKRTGGESPGFGLSLLAESTTHCLTVADASSGPDANDPERIALDACSRLLEEIDSGGCVDSNHQGLVLLMMAFGQEDVHSVRLGRLSGLTVQILRDLRDFTGVEFKVAPERNESSVVLSCIGLGFSNYSKKLS